MWLLLGRRFSAEMIKNLCQTICLPVLLCRLNNLNLCWPDEAVLAGPQLHEGGRRRQWYHAHQRTGHPHFLPPRDPPRRTYQHFQGTLVYLPTPFWTHTWKTALLTAHLFGYLIFLLKSFKTAHILLLPLQYNWAFQCGLIVLELSGATMLF